MPTTCLGALPRPGLRVSIGCARIGKLGSAIAITGGRDALLELSFKAILVFENGEIKQMDRSMCLPGLRAALW